MRTADTADAEALANVHVSSWRAAYHGLIPQEYLDGLDVAAREQRWRSLLRDQEPNEVTVVLDDPTAGVVGFASVGPSRDPDAPSSDVGEVYGLYLVPSHWDKGGGRLLMDEAVRRLTNAGFRTAILWVLDTNQRARRFYEAVGWRPDGAQKVDDSRGFPLSELRYHRDLPR